MTHKFNNFTDFYYEIFNKTNKITDFHLDILLNIFYFDLTEIYKNNLSIILKKIIHLFKINSFVVKIFMTVLQKYSDNFDLREVLRFVLDNKNEDVEELVVFLSKKSKSNFDLFAEYVYEFSFPSREILNLFDENPFFYTKSMIETNNLRRLEVLFELQNEKEFISEILKKLNFTKNVDLERSLLILTYLNLDYDFTIPKVMDEFVLFTIIFYFSKINKVYPFYQNFSKNTKCHFILCYYYQKLIIQNLYFDYQSIYDLALQNENEYSLKLLITLSLKISLNISYFISKYKENNIFKKYYYECIALQINNLNYKEVLFLIQEESDEEFYDKILYLLAIINKISKIEISYLLNDTYLLSKYTKSIMAVELSIFPEKKEEIFFKYKINNKERNDLFNEKGIIEDLRIFYEFGI